MVHTEVKRKKRKACLAVGVGDVVVCASRWDWICGLLTPCDACEGFVMFNGLCVLFSSGGRQWQFYCSVTVDESFGLVYVV